MVLHIVDGNGICNTCNNEANDSEVLTCDDCKSMYHGICETQPIFCNKTFLAMFLKLKSNTNFIFICNTCKTKRENKEASSIKDELSELKDTVKLLAEEFKSFKEAKLVEEIPEVNKWQNKNKVEKMKSSLCIKENDTQVNLNKIQEIAANNGIQVSRAEVKENGDIYVDLPSKENREKITTLLREENLNAEDIVELKSKLPTITILSVNQFSTKQDFIERVKKQNPGIEEKIDKGPEFSIVFSKKSTDIESDNPGKKYFQVVARVNDDIRKIIKMNGDKIYLDLVAHKVIDRFYIKRCNKCQNFGHYQKDCQKEVCCGYCRKSHKSEECNEVEKGDHNSYECANCERSGKCSKGHSAFWHNCPSLLENQEKSKKGIPYYNVQKN